MGFIKDHQVVRCDARIAQARKHPFSGQCIHADNHLIAVFTDKWIAAFGIRTGNDVELQAEQRG